MVDSAGVLIAVAILALAVAQHFNLRGYRRLRALPAPASSPAVSILIPARDEEANIEAVVRSLAGRGGELIVLDDHSSDATAAILDRLRRELPLRVIAGEPLPAGWKGKNWACHQLARAATGEYLLFTDADTRHDGAVETAVALAQETSADLLSLMPRQLTESSLERMTIPLMDFFFVTFFPSFMLERSRDPRFAAANGQFLLFTRAAYDAIGGHESIRDSVVDDLALARRIREKGLTLRVADGHDVVSCRMYRNGSEVIAGFSKNLYAAVGGTPLHAFGIGALMFALFVAPLLLAMTGSLSALAALAAGIGLRMRSDIRAGHSPLLSILHPVSIAIAVAVLARSAIRARRGVVWKGRVVSGV